MKRFFLIVAFTTILGSLFAQSPSFSGGKGTQEDPYQISNEQDLKALADASLTSLNYGKGKHYKQTADIIFASMGEEKGNFIGIGGKKRNEQGEVIIEGDTHFFQGKYDGTEHSISGMFVFNYIGSGFVNALGNEGVVKNLKFVNAKIFSSLGVSGTVAAVNQGTVRNCTAISGFFMSLGGDIGGIVGMNMTTGIVEKCVNHITLNGGMPNNYYYGGIVGNNQGTVKLCANFGNVSANYYGGGVAGYTSEGSRIEYCYNTAKVTCRGTEEASGAGGIAGCLWSNDKEKPAPVVLNCYNYGPISVVQSLPIRPAGAITGFIPPALKVDVQNCYYDEATSLAADPLARALPTEDMKKALTRLNTGATSPMYVADLATPINKGYPILSWQAGNEDPQPGQNKVTMQFAEITIPLGIPYSMFATSCPPPTSPEKKIYWRYVSEDPKVGGYINQFQGDEICTATLLKRAGHVEKNEMTEVLGEASFKVNVIAADQYKPIFIGPILNWGDSREQIKAAEAARGYRLFTTEYFKVTGAKADPSFEVYLTNNTQFPIIMYVFGGTNDVMEEAYLYSASTFMVLNPSTPFAAFMTGQQGYDIYGVSSMTNSNVYHHPQTKVTAQSLAVKIQGGIYGAISYAYDPDKSIAKTALPITAPTTVERAVVSVLNRDVLILPASTDKTAVKIYTVDGRLVVSTIVEGEGRIALPTAGVYLVQVDKQTQKIVVE